MDWYLLFSLECDTSDYRSCSIEIGDVEVPVSADSLSVLHIAGF